MAKPRYSQTITPKQMLFCEEYVKTSNAAQSYIKVFGCKPSSAGNSSILLKQDYIKEYIAELRQDMRNEAIADATEVLIFFSTVMRNEKVSNKDRIKCAEMLAKYHKLFGEQEKPLNNKVVIDLSAIQQ